MGGTSGLAILPGHIKWICIEFANTVGWRASDHPIDILTGFDYLMAWAERNTFLPPSIAGSLLEEAARRPLEAQETFSRAITLRETIYRVFFAVANKLPPNSHDVALLSSSYQEAMAHKRLAEQADNFVFEWEGEETNFDALTWRIAQSAATLLTSDYITRLKSCPGEGCAWLFVDTSRNGTRRWCEMEVCGNRAKVKRFRNVKRET